VTRAASHGDLTESITGTFTAQPATLQTVAAIATLLGGLGVVGWFALPPLPFFCMGAILGGAASHIEKRNLTAQQTQVTAQTQQVHEKVRQPANAMSVLPVDALALEVGRGLLSLVDEAQGAKLLERVTAIRRHVAQELGFIVPGVRFRDNLQLKPNGYSIRVREIEVAQGEVMVAQFLAIAPEEKLRSLRGVKTVDPTYGMPAVWINAEQRGEAERLGCMIFDPVSVVATHLTEVVRSHAADLLGGQEAQALLDTVKRTHPAILRELMPDVLPLVDVRKILQNLLRERVSIRDLVIIVETLADHARSTRDCEALTECVRVALARTICREYVNAEGVINALTLDPGLETALAAPFLDPSVGHAFLSALGLEVSHLQERGLQPIILCAPALRPTVRKLTDLTFPSLVILSWSEMAPRVRVNPLGMVSV
jgi:flagellar biosynthesis protein FlhA